MWILEKSLQNIFSIFDLVNRNYTNEVMNKVIDENGSEFIETKNILKCKQEFYKNNIS